MKNKSLMTVPPEMKLFGGFVDKKTYAKLSLHCLLGDTSKSAFLRKVLKKEADAILFTDKELLTYLSKRIESDWCLKKKFKLQNHSDKELEQAFLIYKNEQKEILIRKGIDKEDIGWILKKLKA